MSEINDELARVRAERDMLREENAKLQGICADGGRRIADLRAERDEYVLKVSSLEKYIKSLQTDRDVTAQLADALQADNDGILEQAERLQAELDTARRDLQARYTPEAWRLLQSGEVSQNPGWFLVGNGVYTPITQVEGQASESEPQPEPQPVQVREGRWRLRNGEIRNVTPTGKPKGRNAGRHSWYDVDHDQTWYPSGRYNLSGEHPLDLDEYLGLIEVGSQPEQTTSEQIAEIEGQAADYTPPEGWRVLAVGEKLQFGDMTVRSDGYCYSTERVGYYVGLNQRYIRRIGPEPESQPEPQPVQNNIPGHIWLTDAETGDPVLVSLPGVAQATKAGVAQVAEARAHWIPAGMGGWHVTVKETPDQIASLIQQEWCDRNSTGGAASAANTGGLIGVL